MESNQQARQSILAKIRERSGSSAHKLDSPPPAPLPKYTDDLTLNLVDSFTDKLSNVHGTSDKVQMLSDVPQTVDAYLSKLGYAGSLLVSTHPDLQALNWSPRMASFRKAKKEDVVSVTKAFAGIAETGTIAMISGPNSPVSPNYLPEFNIAILEVSSIVPTVEDLWPKISEHPRAINLITGPSKTADIEQTIVYGAHGPRRFHVILVET